jgi:site-specific DNA-methyltransferase (adenine-specific)
MPRAESSEWETPQDLFARLDAEFHFTLDPCATAENAKCARYFTREMDGLAQSWDGEVVFMNPPYGRGMGVWIKKASEAMATVACLLPARTDVRWFHDYVYGKAEIRFLRGRLKFGGAKNSAPFPSMIVVFKREAKREGVDGG